MTTATQPKQRQRPRAIRGYVHGVAAAAAYLDMDKRTFNKHVLPHVRPRLFGGHAYWRIADLDRFMDPDRNPPGAETEFFSRKVS